MGGAVVGSVVLFSIPSMVPKKTMTLIKMITQTINFIECMTLYEICGHYIGVAKN
jgi:hypothetical protein